MHDMRYSAKLETTPSDIFVVGHPKSGNTWFRYVQAGLIFGVDVAQVPGQFS